MAKVIEISRHPKFVDYQDPLLRGLYEKIQEERYRRLQEAQDKNEQQHKTRLDKIAEQIRRQLVKV